MRTGALRVVRASGVVLGAAVLVAGCGHAVPAGPPQAALPSYCTTTGSGPDETFWKLVESSCREATDGDAEQGRALKAALQPLSVEEATTFYRTFVRMNHTLYTRRVGTVMDQACAPGLGLGDDLSTDLRSWVIAHGQAAFESVLEDPETLTTFPDLKEGCGLGELFGDVGLRVVRAKGGDVKDLPVMEPDSPPAG